MSDPGGGRTSAGRWVARRMPHLSYLLKIMSHQTNNAGFRH